MDKVYKIRELEQVRLLADPLKLDLLQAFAERDKTAKAVADELGQPVTRLYRHVDALLDAGLLTVVQETPKRGTVETHVSSDRVTLRGRPRVVRR